MARRELLALQQGRYGVTGQSPIAKAIEQANAGTSRAFTQADVGQTLSVARVEVPQQYARPWIVSWSVTDTSPLPTSPDDAAATESLIVLGWGMGGVRHSAIVDAGQGGSATLWGSSVDVSVQPVYPTGAPAYSAVVSASICPGGAPASKQLLRRTIYFTTPTGTVGPGSASATVGIPPFAERFRITQSNPFGFPMPARRIDMYGLLGLTTAWDFPATVLESPSMWVPGDARRVQLTNTDAINSWRSPRVIFDIAL